MMMRGSLFELRNPKTRHNEWQQVQSTTMVDEQVSTYSKYRGFAAAVSSCASFESDRLVDGKLSEVFAKLDVLEQRQVECKSISNFDDVATVLRASNLTARDLTYLNSPLLDGLWKVVTGVDPDEAVELVIDKPVYKQRMLLRLIAPKSYADTIEFLGLLKEHWKTSLREDDLDFFADMPLVEVASGTGHVELVQLFLNCGVVEDVDDALWRAAGNGHLLVMQELLNWAHRSDPNIHDPALRDAQSCLERLSKRCFAAAGL